MVREIITISLGQCGIQLGNRIWIQYCSEHNISKNGTKTSKNVENNGNEHVFFEETASAQFVPRNLSVDLEPNCIDDIKTSSYAPLYRDYFLLAGKEDAANNFARGHYSVGRDILNSVNERIRKLVNNCDNLQGFVVNHAIGGGTGSGFGSLLLERLSINYRKTSKLGFEVYPSENISNCVVEPYNALLATNYLIDYTDINMVLDNEALYGICQRNLDMKVASYQNLNRLIAKVISSMTASLRFKGELNVDVKEYQTNLVPFPRLHFMITSMSPITTQMKKITCKNDTFSLSTTCFDKNSFFIKVVDFEPEEDKYMSVFLNYRGNVKAKEANSVANWLKENKKLTFVDWVPTGFKIGLNSTPCVVVEDDDLAYFQSSATMIGNNACFSKVLETRICKKYDVLYPKRAYVHWFVGEGMEECEFAEARENLEFLRKDYLEVLSETLSDEDDAKNDNDEDY